jgi:four helix bundle protein
MTAYGHKNETDGSSAFRGQLLWQKAQDFGERVAEIIITLKRDQVTDAVGNQLMRSAGSIAANVAEGYGRFSQAAYRSHFSIARGSTFESESWLDLLIRRRYLSEEQGKPLLASCHELGRLLTLRMKSLSNGKTYAVSEEGATYGEE